MGCSSSKAVATNAAPATSDGGITEADKAEYNAIIAEHGPQTEQLFKKLATTDGVIRKARFKEIHLRYSGMTEHKWNDDVDGLFDRFDNHGKPDGTLDVEEFGWYLAAVAKVTAAALLVSSEGEAKTARDVIGKIVFSWYEQIKRIQAEQQEYDVKVTEVADRVAALFGHLDANGNEVLSSDELEHAVGTYFKCTTPQEVQEQEGYKNWDGPRFFAWFEVHGSLDVCHTGPTRAITLKEFGWFLAELATDNNDIKDVVAAFEDHVVAALIAS
jgi:hypothetical protein